MKKPGDENPAGLLTVKHDVFAVIHATQAWANIITGATQLGIVGKELTARLQLAYVTIGLAFAPDPKSISADAQQVVLSPPREAKRGHGLKPWQGKLECLPDARKYVFVGNATGVTFVNGNS
jgi:hypothetical protein